MRTDLGRFYVQLISVGAFRDYMKFRQQSVRSLAESVGCDKSVVGHLRSGKRGTCRPETAIAIEKALNAPPGSLFVAKVSCVVSAEGRAA